MNNKLWLLFVVLATGIILCLGTSIADAAGTPGYMQITNGTTPVGGTLPLSVGELSIAFDQGSGSAYVGTSAVLTVIADTAYDMELDDSGVNWEGYFQKADTVSAGSTATFKVWIRNDGNVAYPINFYHNYSSDSVFISYLVFRDVDNDNQFGLPGDGSALNSFSLAADASETFFFVVSTYDTSPNGSFGKSTGKITDSAPVAYGSTTGDGWEDSNPLGGSDDTEDTFTFTFRTFILGPLMRLSKTIADSSGLRPGDTVRYEIIYDNDGGDSANNLIIVDAIPSYTSFVVGSWTDSAPHSGNITVGFATGLGQDTFADPEGDTTAKIRWTMNSPVGANYGSDGVTTVDNNGGGDDGLIRFQVKIN